MTDMSNGMSQSSDTSSSSSEAVVSQSPSATVDERTFRQSEVSDIVKRAKHEAVESFKRRQNEQPQYVQQNYNDSVNTNQNSNANYNSVLSEEERIRKITANEMQQVRDNWEKEARSKAEKDYSDRVVGNFVNKISPAREKYQDFDKVTGDIEYSRFPNVVHILAEAVDNSGDVLYELGKDRMKMAGLENLAMYSPKDAIIQAQRLSQSIKDNHASSNVRIPKDPLSQMQPSNAGTDDGAMSVSDYRKKYRV